MLTVFIALALSDGTSAYSLALQQDGSVWATGSNSNGQFGDGLKTSSKTFVQVVPRGVIAIAAGALHSMVLKQDGSVWATGWNGNGQLGDGTTTDEYSFKQVACKFGPTDCTTDMHRPALLQP